MIFRLAKVFFYSTFIWLVAFTISWFGGGYVYAAFSGLRYFPEWSDVMTIIRLTLVVSMFLTLLTWIKTRST
jgi:hypothetical protein